MIDHQLPPYSASQCGPDGRTAYDLFKNAFQQAISAAKYPCVRGLDSVFNQGELKRFTEAGLLKPRSTFAPVPETSHGQFVITDKGLEFVKEVVKRVLDSQQDFQTPSGFSVPHWDAVRRELQLGNAVIKRLRSSAPNQELILAAFEEAAWPQQILDPLPPKENLVPAVRLHDTINRLNKGMLEPLIRFGGDGTGTGVYWRLCPEQSVKKFSDFLQSPPIATR